MNSTLNILHLKYFCDSVLYNSVSEAAKINFVTQSAVSHGISKLERTLGIQLLSHSRQKFQVTEEGKIVFDHARHVFKSIQDIYDGLNQNKKEVNGTLKFVTTKSLGMSLIAPSYKQVKDQFPGIDINVRLGGLNFIRNSIKQGDVEFGVVVYDQDFKQFAKHPLKKGKFNIYQCINPKENYMEDGVLVNYFEGTHVKELREHLKRNSNLCIKTELSGWEIVARFTELNMGLGFFPDYIMDNDRYPKIVPYPLDLPLFEYEICIIYNKGGKLSRAAWAFIEQFPLDFF